MKKLLGIVVLGLLLSHNSFAKTINIDDKILLNVPENFNYIKIETDEVADYYAEFFSSLGEDAAFYYVGTDDSIEFANAMVNDQDKVLEPIMKKMEKKNFSTEKSMINFVSKEIKKLMKKRKYQGVIWVLVSEENLEDTDYDLFETVESLKNMNQADMNKEALEYKKELKEELSVDGVEGLNLKVSKFKIEKNKINSPAFDLKIAANMFNINWDMEVYGYLKNNKPIIVGSECIGKCKGVTGIKNMIVYSNTTSTNTSSESSSNIVDNLNKLNDLYKSGVLTKEEFEKAKKKLLN
tara:strand:- start:46 stop:930 length:885 start_codon:yes stop_codon:yes gene_type:complete